MFFDWLAREGGIVLSWWALVTLAGVAALPLCLRLLGGLPDRGYTLARAAGLLLTGFVFWLLATLGFLRNTTDSMVLAWVIVLIAALLVYFGAGKERIDLRAWWSENRRVVIIGEVLFFVLLFSWSVYRAYQNGLTGTEKPMELAFMSATMRSATFPPADPWLSGYAISYYYFGYVLAAMLSMLSGISSTIGFNMTNALLFALTGLTAFGVVYNLVRSRAQNGIGQPSRGVAALVGLLGTVFVILLGNFQLILVEIPYQTQTASPEYLQFWDMNERQTPLQGVHSADVMEWGDWWWFRGSRALNDRNLDGTREEVIDEFPQFSFLLADNHPHVLALPFAVLALGLALNTLLLNRSPNAYEIVFYSLCFGGLIFLNTWDAPVYLLVLVASDALRRLIARGRLTGQDWRELMLLGGTLLVLAVVFYLPFIAAFRSQLGGILPNLQYPTLFRQYFAMFGPLLLILVPFLAVEVWRAGARMNWGVGIQVGLFLLLGLFGLMLALSALAAIIPGIRDVVLNFVNANGGWGSVLPALFAKRLSHILTSLVLLVGVFLIAARLFPRRRDEAVDDEQLQPVVNYSPQTGFALLLVAAAMVLTLVPEFVYLRDNFSTRMNTVFKLYYQAWLMFAIASAYAAYSVLAGRSASEMRESSGETTDARHVPSLVVRTLYSALLVVVLAAGLLYPILGVTHRMFVETGRTRVDFEIVPSLNGGGTISGNDDYQAALCLGELAQGDDVVLASAVGGSYNWPSGIASTYTGIPTVFNWPGHESQWRGPTYGEVAGSRESDMNLLFSDPTWNTARMIINKYGIDYVFFGSSERDKFGSTSEIKFQDNLELVCLSGDTHVFHVPEQAVVGAR